MPAIGPKTKTASATKDMCPEDSGKPNLSAAFMPFGLDYKGGLSLATGWLAGTLGGTERIVVGQLAAPGAVKVFSSGSALQGGPAMYLAPADHSPIVGFSEMASFTPFDGEAGVTVATTSTTHGADLLVSGVSAKDKTAQVAKVPVGQALAASDQHAGQEDRHGGVEGRFGAECAWRRLMGLAGCA